MPSHGHYKECAPFNNMHLEISVMQKRTDAKLLSSEISIANLLASTHENKNSEVVLRVLHFFRSLRACAIILTGLIVLLYQNALFVECGSHTT